MSSSPLPAVCPRRACPRRRRPRSPRGFTLIELLVAITAGLFVAITAYAMAKQGSRFFQQEARVANAQFAATVGFDRLRADIARAAFLSSANAQRDPRRCGDASLWPAGLKSLGAVRLDVKQPTAAQNTLNGLTPDTLTLSGSYSSDELFPVRAVVAAPGNTFNVYLQTNTGAMRRATGGDLDAGTLSTVFRAGRMMRLLEQATGRYEFGVIQGYAPDASGNPVVTLAASAPIPFRKQAGSTCGVEGNGTGMQASVVNWIRYGLRDLHGQAAYAPLFANPAPGDDGRLELTRVELDANYNEMADTLELVAEYAVDLRFAFTVVTSTPPAEPVLARLAFDDARNASFAHDVADNPAAPGPERIRNVRARLAVRSREADRPANLPALGGQGNVYRYQLPNGLGFARVRTLTAEIDLPNLARLSW